MKAHIVINEVRLVQELCYQLFLSVGEEKNKERKNSSMKMKDSHLCPITLTEMVV